MARKELKVSTISDLKKYADGEVLELPSFSEGVPFVARLRRPSMLDLVRSKKIPNSLLESANKLFSQGTAGVLLRTKNNDSAMDELFGLLDIICDAAFIDPSYREMREAGITLTDEQMIFVFSYVQRGVTALEKFRGERGGSESNISV